MGRPLLFKGLDFAATDVMPAHIGAADARD
jgi:uncharacterized protein with PIN domain